MGAMRFHALLAGSALTLALTTAAFAAPSASLTVTADCISGVKVAQGGGTESPKLAGAGGTESPKLAGAGGPESPKLAGAGGTESPKLAGAGGTESPKLAGAGGTESPKLPAPVSITCKYPPLPPMRCPAPV